VIWRINSRSQPGSSTERKVLELLQYNLVQHRIEFDVAWDAVGRLRAVNRRVRVATVAFALLLRSDPSETAIKYFRKACSLFLAGYQSEVAVMCGAVLEAALGMRVDDAMKKAGVRPQFQRTSDYATKQRIGFEATNQFFTSEQREMFWEVVRWRNDAAHVQPDLAPPPEQPLVFTASLLPLILPRAVPL